MDKIEKSEPKFQQKFLVSFLYFIQGVFLVVPSTITLTYSQIPSYGILAYFSAATLPFSFKFLIAPVIEKYTWNKYGRRKTWVVISLLVSSILIFYSSTFVEDEEKQIQTAILWTAIVILISIQDISTDALAIKQLEDAQLASYLQNVMQTIGAVSGSLLFIQLVSKEGIFKTVGFTVPMMSPSTFIKLISLFSFISSIIIHFKYNQKKTKKEGEGIDHSFLEVVQHYKHFLNPKYRLCRQAFLFLVYSHGLTYFKSGYGVQLMKNHGFSKEMMNTFGNFLIIPVFILTYVLRVLTSKYKVQYLQVYYRSRFVFFLQVVSCFLIFIFEIRDTIPTFCAMTWMTLLSSCQFFMDSIIVNKISDSLFAGMYVTMMASASNLGRNSTINLKIIDEFGFEKGCYFGFIYCVGSLLVYGKIIEWIKAGKEEEDIEKKKVQ